MIRNFIEAIYWFGIFLSPVLMTVLLIGIVSSIFGFHGYYCWLLLPGAMAGILLAEYARKKYGCSNYWSKPMNTPDIRETWEIEREKDNQKLSER